MSFTDVSGVILEGLSKFLVPRSYLSLKSRMFTALCVSIAFQLGVEAEYIPNTSKPWLGGLKFSMSDSNLGVVLACGLVLCFLLSTDLVLAWQRKRMALRLIEMLKDNSLEPETRQWAMQEIVRLNQSLF